MIRRYSDFTVYRRLLGMSRRYWPHILGIFLLSLLSTPLTLLAPVPLKIAVDNVIGSEPLPGWADSLLPAGADSSDLAILLFAALLLVAIQAATQLQSVSKSLLGTYAGEKLVLRLRSRLFDHAQRLSLGYHDSKGTADSIYRIQSDATSIQMIAVDGVIPFVAAAVTLVSMLLVTAAIDPALAVIALCITPILFALTWGYRRRLRERYRRVKGLESSALSVVQEALGSVRVVKAFGQEEREAQRFVVKAEEGTRARIRVALVDNSFSLLIGLVMAVGTALVLYVGVRQVKAGSLTLGDLLLVMAYLAALYAPLYTITRKVTSLQSAFASAERALTLLDEEPEVVQRPDAIPLGRSSGRAVFDRVSFSYDGTRRALEDVSFEVSAGMRVGVAGRTGAGKTTLVNLLTRLYDPTVGTISLDGHDLRDYRLTDLRNQFGIVLQEPVLFSTTIFENIAYGRPDATFDEVIAAADAANAHDFVAALPDGYDTVLGDRGVTLSGGERQRVSLARAFLKDAPILILDEPTSSVDVGTEERIMEAMERLMEGRTTFIIAHRLGTLEGCDLRLEIDQGRLTITSGQRGDLPGGVVPRPRERVARRGFANGTGHPALRAWEELVGDHGRLRAVETLKKSSNGQVYRLHSADSALRVVAKRDRADKLDFERTVYEQVLPKLRVPSAAYYGFLEEVDTRFAWLFVEDLGDVCLRPEDERQLAEAARFLGALHSSPPSSLTAFPDRGPAYYRACLLHGHDQLRRALPTVPLERADQSLIRSVIVQCDRVEGVWDRIEAACAGLPAVPVHGDFQGKNVRLKQVDGRLETIAFDWETAGNGLPAADAAILGRHESDIAFRHYLRAIHDAWPELTLDDVMRLVDVGLLFQTLQAVSWASWISPGWVERPLQRLAAYERRLGPALERTLRHA